MPDRSIPPVSQPPQTFRLPEARLYKADNGLPVHIISSATLPVIKLEFVFRGGTWFESHAGNALFAIKMLGEGTAKHTSSQISDFFDRHGAFLEYHGGPDYSTVVLYTVKRHLHDLCPLLAECVFEPVFPEAELSLLKAIQKQELLVNLEKNSYVATRLFRKQVFGHAHPYGRSISADIVDDQHHDQLGFYHKEVLRGDFEIVASGDIDDATLQCLEDHFGNSDRVSPKSFEPVPYVYKPDKIRMRSKKELQASIRIGKPMIGKSHADYMACMLTNEILGGYFGSRLMQNIREEKGYTYGIHSSIVVLKNDAYFVIGTDVKQEHVDATIREIHRELHRMSTELIDGQELNTVKNYIKGSYLSSITTPFSIAEKVKNIRFYDLDYSFYHNFFERLDSITAEDIMHTAEKYFSPDAMTEVVVG